MRISASAQFNNNQPHFNGTIKDTPLLKNYAIEYAKNIKISDSDWPKLKIFINTLRAIKKDNTTDEFIIDTIKTSKGRQWFLKYGDYLKKDEIYPGLQYSSLYGYNIHKEDVFRKVVDFGKEHFGYRIISKPIEEFMPANKYLKNANKFLSASRLDKNKFVKEKLLEKAQREEKKANDAIATIRMAVLDNLQ